MWVVSGPFDGELNVTNFQKSKLLKPGKQYTLGRKARALTINNRHVSHNHLSFQVGDYTEQDVENPDVIPSIKMSNFSSKNRKVVRGTQELIVSEDQSCELQDGDIVHVLVGVLVSVKWEKVCCLSYPPREQSPISIPDCMRLGISVVLTPHAAVTHHLTPTYNISPAIAASLLSLAHFVKPDWLTALLTLSVPTDDGQCPLERSFSLPRVADYRPDYSPSVPSTLRTIRCWEPNEARVNMFSNYRIIFVGERGREVNLDTRELVKRGGGEYECCAVDGGRKSLHGILAKGKGKRKDLVLIADEPAMGAAVGQKEWMEMVDEAATFGLRFIRAERLSLAVSHVNFSYINCTIEDTAADDGHRFSSPLPDVVPNTHPGEPSIAPKTLVSQSLPQPSSPPPAISPGPSTPPPPRRKLVRRAPSQATSKAPSPPPPALASNEIASSSQSEKPQEKVVGIEEGAAEPKESEPEIPRPRRPLVRRAGRPKPTAIIGIDDPFMLLDGDSVSAGGTSESTPAPEPPKPRSTDLTAPTPRRPLKRRAGTQIRTQFPPVEEDEPIKSIPEEEPPLKKFKDLFDASDPDRIAQSGMAEYMNMYKDPQSVTQSENQTGTSVTQGVGSSKSLTRLGAVPEEEEESTNVSGSRGMTAQDTLAKSQGLKRKARVDDEDVEMEDAVQEQGSSKRRAVEGVDAVEPAPSQILASQAAQSQTSPSKTTQKPASKVFNSKTNTESSTKAAPSGAAAGKPDKDEAFLKAVASTKRGKKHEDAFDREFNNLRISKPDLTKDEAVKEWAVLEEFGDDGDLRGNFMVVVELEPFTKGSKGDQGVFRRGEGRLEWEGRPDFKKFKKKSVGERRKPIELVVEDDDEFGLSSQLWKNVTSQPRAVSHVPVDEDDVPLKKPKSSTQTHRRTQPVIVDSDDEVPQLPLGRSKRSATPATQSAPTRAKSTRRTQTKGKSTQPQPLFIESDEDEDLGKMSEGEEFDGALEEPDMTLPTVGTRTQESPRKPRSNAKKRAAAVVLDDDSDDAVAFKGFTKSRKRIKR